MSFFLSPLNHPVLREFPHVHLYNNGRGKKFLSQLSDNELRQFCQLFKPQDNIDLFVSYSGKELSLRLTTGSVRHAFRFKLADFLKIARHEAFFPETRSLLPILDSAVQRKIVLSQTDPSQPLQKPHATILGKVWRWIDSLRTLGPSSH